MMAKAITASATLERELMEMPYDESWGDVS